ncbi:hypothetical protein ACFWAN_51175 [Streptomyces mirabilis]|uniref:hypothetical protein n=1 Tax=Streptomyces mirabilis TaxID=68239 RepID=UPI0036497185
MLRPLIDGRTVDLATLADTAGLALEDVVELVQGLVAGQAAVAGGPAVTAALALGTYRCQAIPEAAARAAASGAQWVDTAPTYVRRQTLRNRAQLGRDRLDLLLLPNPERTPAAAPPCTRRSGTRSRSWRKRRRPGAWPGTGSPRGRAWKRRRSR